MGCFVGADIGYDGLDEGQDEPPGTIAVCKGAGVDAGNQGQGRQFGVLLYWGREGRITAACDAVAKRIEIVCWIC